MFTENENYSCRDTITDPQGRGSKFVVIKLEKPLPGFELHILASSPSPNTADILKNKKNITRKNLRKKLETTLERTGEKNKSVTRTRKIDSKDA